MFIRYEAEVSSRVGGSERGVGDFGKLFTETNEQKFSLGRGQVSDDKVSEWLTTMVTSTGAAMIQMTPGATR